VHLALDLIAERRRRRVSSSERASAAPRCRDRRSGTPSSTPIVKRGPSSDDILRGRCAAFPIGPHCSPSWRWRTAARLWISHRGECRHAVGNRRADRRPITDAHRSLQTGRLETRISSNYTSLVIYMHAGVDIVRFL
jgi:hypothetical protein